jgi:hypothetical protein
MVAVFTVHFEDPFWVGVLESEDEGSFVVARHVFGAEPSNAELRDFLLYEFAGMRRTIAGRAPESGPSGPKNPKRGRRDAMRDIARPPSTKAQAALQAARSDLKSERKASSREERLAEAERRFALRSEKRKRRHRGR